MSLVPGLTKGQSEAEASVTLQPPLPAPRGRGGPTGRSAPPFLAHYSHSKSFSQLPFLSVLSLPLSLDKRSKTDLNFYLLKKSVN